MTDSAHVPPLLAVRSGAHIGGRRSRQRNEFALRHSCVSLQKRQVQFHNPLVSVFPACVRMQDFAVWLVPVEMQDALVRWRLSGCTRETDFLIR